MCSKNGWKDVDDKLLKEIVESQSKMDWNRIAEKFNSFEQNLPKSAKQLRERYSNHSRFIKDYIAPSQWSNQQVKYLMSLYHQCGPKWTQICKFFKGRSQNSLKNKFYGNIRKFLRRINAYVGKLEPSFARPIKYESLIRILQVQDSNISLPKQLKLFSQHLRTQMINNCLEEGDCQDEQSLLRFVQDLRKFNTQTRCYKIKKDYKKRAYSPKQCEIQTSNVRQIYAQGSGQREFSADDENLNANNGLVRMKKQRQIDEDLSSKKEQNLQYEPVPCFRDYDMFQRLQTDDLRQSQILQFQFCQILGIKYTHTSFSFEEIL